jgi:hypothetical protein
MAMAKVSLVKNDVEYEYESDKFNEEQSQLLAEATSAERELLRYKYHVAIFEDRRAFILEKLIDSLENDKKET